MDSRVQVYVLKLHKSQVPEEIKLRKTNRVVKGKCIFSGFPPARLCRNSLEPVIPDECSFLHEIRNLG